ncbi:MAG: MFS transporter [Anaerolineae bacterium]
MDGTKPTPGVRPIREPTDITVGDAARPDRSQPNSDRNTNLERTERLTVVDFITTALPRALGFVRRQKSNYRVAITRSAASSFLMNLSAPYDTIYTAALGADSVALGTISSIGSGVGALISTPAGWLVDRFGIKRFYVLAMVLLAAYTLTYAVAPSWEWIAVATILFSVSTRLVGTGCSVICADSVQNPNRATAQNLCVTFSSAASLIAPLVAAYLITLSGGLKVEGMRPLYYVRFVGSGLLLLFVAARLREPDRARPVDSSPDRGFLRGYERLFAGHRVLRRWIVIAALTSLPMAMTSPFLYLYAHEVKGANQYLLGVMTTATVLTRMLFGIPLGRLADRIGRKKVIFLLTPLWYASNLLLAFSTSSVTLIIAASLQTFYAVSSGITSAMSLELVPLERMGRWSGTLGLFSGLIAIPAPAIGGLIWQKFGPLYVFLVPLVIDLALRIPLLTTIPETLEADPVT